MSKLVAVFSYGGATKMAAQRIINTFFDSVKLEGVKIHLFATSGGSGIQNSFRELKITYPGLSFIDAKMM